MARSKEDLEEVRAAARGRRDAALIKKVIESFPREFGIRGMPARKFEIDWNASRVVDGRVQLMILMREESSKEPSAKAKMIPFAKASPEELRRDLDMRAIEAERNIRLQIPAMFHLYGDNDAAFRTVFRVVPGSIRTIYVKDGKTEIVLAIEAKSGGKWSGVYKPVRHADIKWGINKPDRGEDVDEVVRQSLLTLGTINYHRLSEITGVPMPGSVIPKDLEGQWQVWGMFYLRILRATGAYAKHRVFITCSCGEWVPLGRFNQHTRGDDHKRRYARKNLSVSARKNFSVPARKNPSTSAR